MKLEVDFHSSGCITSVLSAVKAQHETVRQFIKRTLLSRIALAERCVEVAKKRMQAISQGIAISRLNQHLKARAVRVQNVVGCFHRGLQLERTELGFTGSGQMSTRR